MMQQIERKPKYAHLWRVVARFWGTITAGAWFVVIVVHALTEPLSEISDEGVALGILMTTAIVLTSLAWHWEQEAGALLLLCGVALSLFAINTAGRNRILAMLVSGAPFILSACLFMASAWMNGADE